MASSVVVVDAGPLIYLAILNRLDILHTLFGHLHLPEEVYQEVVVQGAGEPGAMDLRTTGTIGVLLLARQSGLDIDLRSSLDALIASGFRLSRDVYQQIVSEHN